MQPVTHDRYVANWRQKQFHEVKLWTGLTKLFKGAVGALGGGKSAGCEHEQVDICLRTPGGASAALRGSLPDAEKSLLEDYRRYLAGTARWNQTIRAFVFENGHRLYIMPADRPDRLGSMQYVSVYFQEAQEIAWRVVLTALDRVRHPAGLVDGFPYHRVLFDARGVNTSHWVAKDFLPRSWKLPRPDDAEPPMRRETAKNPHWVYAQFKTNDNRQHLPPGYYETNLHEHRDDPAWCKTYLDGELGHEVGGISVFGDSYDPKRNEVDRIEPDQGLPILRGWDFGYNHPAVVWCQFSRQGRFVVLRELCPSKCSRDRLVREARALQAHEFSGWYEGNFRDFGDIAGQQANSADMDGITDMEYLEEQMGTAFEGLQKSPVDSGLSVIRELMKGQSQLNGETMNHFLVDKEGCPTLCEALRGMYYYDEKSPTRKPKKGNGFDNVVDAVRYVVQVVWQEREYDLAGAQDQGWVSSFARYN
jgi:hypothetical protein